jgi:hypothetical protein
VLAFVGAAGFGDAFSAFLHHPVTEDVPIEMRSVPNEFRCSEVGAAAAVKNVVRQCGRRVRNFPSTALGNVLGRLSSGNIVSMRNFGIQRIDSRNR